MSGVTLIRRGLMSVVVAGGVLVMGLVAERAILSSEDAPALSWDVAADVRLSGFDLQQVGIDGPELAVKAHEARLLEAEQTVLATGLDVLVYDKGQQAARLVAERGEVQLQGQQITVYGDTTPARLTVTDGPTLSSPSLHWNPDTRMVTTNGGATVHQPGFSATGGDAVVQVDQQTVQMHGGVQVVWNPPSTSKETR